MGFVSRVGLEWGHADSTGFEYKSCGASYELDRQVCIECGGHCIGYSESWIRRERFVQPSSEHRRQPRENTPSERDPESV